MNDQRREPGWYWSQVQVPREWTPMHWDGRIWTFDGGGIDDGAPEAIGLRIPSPDQLDAAEKVIEDESDGSSSFATGGAYIREVRQFEPLTDAELERLDKAVMDVIGNEPFVMIELPSVRCRLAIIRAAYAAILGGKEG